MRLLCPILALGVLLGAGCGGDDDDVAADTDTTDATDSSDTTGTTAPADSNPLAGRTFLAESATENGQPRAFVEGTQVELSFEHGQVGAAAGCNSMSGPVTVDGDRLLVGELTSTLIGCSPDLATQDAWLTAILIADPTFRLDGDRLTIEGDGSVLELVAEAVADPARPLLGTAWQVESLVDGDTVSSVPAGVVGTLTFGEDGRVQVNVCNQGSATVTVGETDIEVGPLVMTRMACEPGVVDVENAVVAVLEGTVTYQIDGPTLTLTHPSGKGLSLRAP